MIGCSGLNDGLLDHMSVYVLLAGDDSALGQWRRLVAGGGNCLEDTDGPDSLRCQMRTKESGENRNGFQTVGDICFEDFLSGSRW